MLPLLNGCGWHRRGHITSRLEAIEQLLPGNPDSALTLLSLFPADSISYQADSMLYALLLAQARARTGEPSTSADTLRHLVEYYKTSKGNHQHRLMYANYTLGIACLDSSRYNQAILPLLDAEQLAIATEDYFTLGLIYRQIAFVYLRTYCSHENLYYERKSVDAFERSGNREYANYERCNLAAAMYEDGKAQEAVDTMKKVVATAHIYGDTVTLVDAYSTMALSNMSLGKYKEAIENFNAVIDLDETLDDQLLQLMGVAYEKCGQISRADSIFCQFDLDKTSTFASLHATYARQGNYEAAYKGLKSMVRYTDSIFKNHLHESVNLTVSDYLDSRHQIETKENTLRHQRIILFSLTLVGLLIAVVAVIYLRKRNLERRNKEIVSELEDTARELKEQIKDNNDESRRYSVSALQVLANQYAVLDELCRNYSENPDGTSPAKYAKLLKNTIRGLGDNDEFATRVLSDFNVLSNNLISELKNTNQNFKPADFKLLAFLVAGFSSSSISVFLQLSKSVVYDRKYRLKQKIANLDFSRKEELLKYFS